MVRNRGTTHAIPLCACAPHPVRGRGAGRSVGTASLIPAPGAIAVGRHGPRIDDTKHFGDLENVRYISRVADQFRHAFVKYQVGISAQRASIRTLPPSVQPNCFSP